MTRAISQSKNGILIQLHISPNAPKSEWVGLHDDALKIRIKAPPVEGKANAEIIRFLAETLDIRQNQVTIIRGETGKRKSVLVTGMRLEDVQKRFGSTV